MKETPLRHIQRKILKDFVYNLMWHFLGKVDTKGKTNFFKLADYGNGAQKGSKNKHKDHKKLELKEGENGTECWFYPITENGEVLKDTYIRIFNLRPSKIEEAEIGGLELVNKGKKNQNVLAGRFKNNSNLEMDYGKELEYATRERFLIGGSITTTFGWKRTITTKGSVVVAGGESSTELSASISAMINSEFEKEKTQTTKEIINFKLPAKRGIEFIAEKDIKRAKQTSWLKGWLNFDIQVNNHKSFNHTFKGVEELS